MAEQNRGQNRTGKQNRLNMTDRKGQAKWDRQNRTGRTGQPEKERHVWQLEQDSQNGAARMGHADQDCKDRTNRTGC